MSLYVTDEFIHTYYCQAPQLFSDINFRRLNPRILSVRLFSSLNYNKLMYSFRVFDHTPNTRGLSPFRITPLVSLSCISAYRVSVVKWLEVLMTSIKFMYISNRKRDCHLCSFCTCIRTSIQPSYNPPLTQTYVQQHSTNKLGFHQIIIIASYNVLNPTASFSDLCRSSSRTLCWNSADLKEKNTLLLLLPLRIRAAPPWQTKMNPNRSDFCNFI